MVYKGFGKVTNALLAFLFVTTLAAAAFAKPDFGEGQPCPRFAAGSVVTAPPDLFSQNGVLTVNFQYHTRIDSYGRTLYCFMTPEGLESPTLHVRPGDTLVVNLLNTLAPSRVEMQIDPPNCGAGGMTATSVNIHYHGTNTSPNCTADEAIKTLVNSGQSFTYKIAFPADEPPGLYWYHPHVHGIASPAVQGGASGAIVVEGIQDLVPEVAGLPERILLVRDQNVPGNPPPNQTTPSWDVELNYVPVPYPNYPPTVIQIRPGTKEFWRVGNLCADTIVDLQLVYDGTPQPMQLVSLDSVPLGSQDPGGHVTPITVTDIFIPPAGRAEFIITGPSTGVQTATFLTEAINTGPLGDSDPMRPLATLQAGNFSEPAAVPAVDGKPWRQRFAGVATTNPLVSRTLYFSEVYLSGPSTEHNHSMLPKARSYRYSRLSDQQQAFLITVEGEPPRTYDPNNPPAIVTTQGSVEQWTIQNESMENHEFHMHQIHFKVLAENNFEINGTPTNPTLLGQYMDTVQVPYWDGNQDHPFPSITVLMDFRGPDTGDFVYHCHILDHEDGGMMAIIRVNPAVISEPKNSSSAVTTRVSPSGGNRRGGETTAPQPAALPKETLAFEVAK